MLIFVWLILLVPPTQSKVRKDEPIMDKVTDSLYVSKGDIDELSRKVNYWLIGAVGFIAFELYKIWLKKGDRSSEKLDKLVEAVARIEIEIKIMPTRDEARKIAREELSHYHDIQGK